MTTIAERASSVIHLNNFYSSNIGPEEVGAVRLNCPHKRQYVLRMLLNEPHGELKIPEELLWTKNALEMAIKYQKNNVRIAHSHCYITVRHGLVDSVADDEWHVDGFSTKINHIPEQNYVWSNVSPTEYIKDQPIFFPIDFNPLKHNVHKYIQARVIFNDKMHTCESETMYCMDPYVIHRRPPVTEGMLRTFIRISFTPIPIMDHNNTKNPLLSDQWQVFSRDGVSIREQLKNYDHEK